MIFIFALVVYNLGPLFLRTIFGSTNVSPTIESMQHSLPIETILT